VDETGRCRQRAPQSDESTAAVGLSYDNNNAKTMYKNKKQAVCIK